MSRSFDHRDEFTLSIDQRRQQMPVLLELRPATLALLLLGAFAVGLACGLVMQRQSPSLGQPPSLAGVDEPRVPATLQLAETR